MILIAILIGVLVGRSLLGKSLLLHQVHEDALLNLHSVLSFGYLLRLKLALQLAQLSVVASQTSL